MNNNKLSIEEMKMISHEIIDEEVKRTGINNNVFPLTFIEYYNNYIFKGKFSLIKKATYSVMPVISSGFNDLDGDVIIFLDRINIVKRPYGKLFNLLRVCYHELRHSMQWNFDNYSYDKFLLDLDNYYKKFVDINDYYNNHDKYSFEIGANIYSVDKASEYLFKKYPEIYNLEKENIKKLKKRYYNDYLMYDASFAFDRVFQTIKKNKMIFKENLYDNNPILEIFLDDNLCFKRIDEIINNELFNLLDNRIVSAIISSDSYLKELNIDNLSISDLIFINKYLEYTYNLYNNQLMLLDKNNKDYKKLLKRYNNRINNIYKYISISDVNKISGEQLFKKC